MKANPAISAADYKLTKGEELFIPYPVKTAGTTETSASKGAKSAESKKSSVIRIGIMLPLHNEDGDGRRMLEYYRGFLMACDSLRAKGISTDVYAWNVPADADIRLTLLDNNAKRCNLIFGPLYTKQLRPLANFCRANDIKLIVPFSISGNDVDSNPHIYQVYQSPETLSERAIKAFMERFPDCHPVFIDCNDTTSNKGSFTFGLRKQLEAKGIAYSITNLKSSEAYFAKAFSTTKRNVVILNTGRSPQLNVALAKLDGLSVSSPGIRISMFGYTEWLMYTKVYLNYFTNTMPISRQHSIIMRCLKRPKHLRHLTADGSIQTCRRRFRASLLPDMIRRVSSSEANMSMARSSVEQRDRAHTALFRRH